MLEILDVSLSFWKPHRGCSHVTKSDNYHVLSFVYLITVYCVALDTQMFVLSAYASDSFPFNFSGTT